MLPSIATERGVVGIVASDARDGKTFTSYNGEITALRAYWDCIIWSTDPQNIPPKHTRLETEIKNLLLYHSLALEGIHVLPVRVASLMDLRYKHSAGLAKT